MLRQAPYDKIGQLPTPRYTNADPSSGDQGSIPNAETFNQLQYEGESLVAAGGLTADGANLYQWTQAISRGGIWAGPLTGTGDLAVATLAIPNSGLVLPALLQGMRVAALATAANTTAAPKLRLMNVGSAGGYVDFSIVKEDGSALAVGEIKVGRRYRYEADGAGNVMISGGGLFSGAASNIVKQVGLTFGGFTSYGAQAANALTKADTGRYINFNASARSFTLPPLNTVLDGDTIFVINTTNGFNMTAGVVGSDQIFDGIGLTTSLNLAYSEDAIFVAVPSQGQWSLISGSLHTRCTRQFTSSLGTSGYANFPDKTSPTGFKTLIWGLTTITAGANTPQAVALVPSFPNLCFKVTPVSASVGSTVGYTGASQSSISLFASNNGAVVSWEAWGY